MIVWTYPSDRSGEEWEPRPKRDAPEPTPEEEAKDERKPEKPAPPRRPRPALYVVP